MRLFVAVPLPDSTRAGLAKWGRSCGPQPGLRWTPAEQLHITLQFLGEVADDRVSRVVDVLDGIAVPAFKVVFERLEVLGRAGVLAVAAKPTAESTLLAGEVRTRLASFAEDPEKREFRLHATVARARRGSSVPKLRTFPPLPALEFTAHCFRLYRSELRPQGAVHTVIREWPLREATAQL
jgi:RNA 2',3'-cyclic 3'-phosphodiesterase